MSLQTEGDIRHCESAVILAVAMVERDSEVWESDNDFSDFLLLPLKKSIATDDNWKEARRE